ncbi:MAG: hypothetical protein KatS3mg057_0094 [Herpetosiphonaceae bacterium]|nr:MAG: hypothetical protein KatS3mg057_0094 [Herpetosiphonaceae bacterium]
MHATAALHLYRHAPHAQRAREFLEWLFPRLAAWHAYLYRERDPQGEGLVALYHPWESGQDNSPIWDAALQRIQLRPDQIPAYRRVDTTIVAAAERPTNAEYDRYSYLVSFFAERNYEDARISGEAPLLVQDVLFNTLLCHADRDLAAIARELGEDPRPFEQRAEQSARAIDGKLWDDEHGIYINFDLVAGVPIHAHVAAGFLPLFAGIPGMERARRMYHYLNSPSFCALDEQCYPVPSYDRQADDFSPVRYWRGPVWINIDWMLYQGLKRYGFDEYAGRIRRTIIELPERHGFYEYFDPLTGQGHGASDFSWTAALLIEVLLE